MGKVTSAAVVLTVLLLLGAGPVRAAWSAAGSTEPDTPQDRDDGFMFVDPDTAASGPERLYFNAIALSGTSVAAGRVNPNAAGSRLAPPGSFEAFAFLGTWKDCNRDGYVGDAVTGALAYRVERLSTQEVCGAAPRIRDGWVHEFRWVVSADPNVNDGYYGHAWYYEEPSFIVDAEAAVWGDRGRPGDARPASCNPTEFGRGTTTRTGGLLAHADCATGHLVVSAIHAVDDSGSLGLRFQDEYAPQKDCDHPLNRPIGVWNDANRCPGDKPGLLAVAPGESAVTVFDCDAPNGRIPITDPTWNGETSRLPQRVDVPPTDVPGVISVSGLSVTVANEEHAYAYVPLPAPALNDPQGSYYETVEDAMLDAVFNCQEPLWVPFYWVLVFAMPWWVQFGNTAIWEEPSEFDPRTGKRVTDFVFAYGSEGERRLDPYLYEAAIADNVTLWAVEQARPLNPPLVGDEAYHVVRPVVGDAPQALGFGVIEAGGGWRTQAPSIGLRNGPPGYFGNLLRSDSGVGAVEWATFYARVGGATLTRATAHSPAGGTYGAEACAGATSGVVNGWDCDSTHWWSPEHGQSPPPDGTNVGSPGMAYHLRDVDCYDGTLVAAAPAPTSLFEGACPEVVRP